MTKRQIALIILKAVGAHLLRRWYIYATFLILLLAPFPIVLVIVLGWLGFFSYRLYLSTRKG